VGRGEEEGVDAGPIEVGAGVRWGLERRRAKAKVEARVVLNPTRREWVEFEDGRLSSPQLAGGSRPSLGDQEKEVKRVCGDGVQTPILLLNQSGRPIVQGGRKWYSTGR